MPDIQFQCRPATDKEREFTAQKLREHTESSIGLPVTSAPFGLTAYDGQKLVGSIVGKIYFNWLHVDLIWVDKDYQRKGIGRHLMKIAAEQASKAGLQGIEVWTQSWQAPEFYRKLGYEEIATIDDFTPGRKRHAFRWHLPRKVVL